MGLVMSEGPKLFCKTFGLTVGTSELKGGRDTAFVRQHQKWQKKKKVEKKELKSFLIVND